MTLTDYLQSEQAREDVRGLLAEPSQPLGELAPGSEARIGSVRTNPIPVTWSDYQHSGIAWRQVELDHADGCLSVYYRPDGDRYIVTDLGEGVRALRLRTACNFQAASHASLAALTEMQRYPILGWSVQVGAVEVFGVRQDNLPDAICRVMLASLKVSEVAT